MAFLFLNLKVYNRAVDLAEQITDLTQAFPKGTFYITDQLNRAVLSISLNLAEGNGRFHIKDRQNFFRISRGSAFECVPLLELCKRKKFIEEQKFNALIVELDEICKMISGLINKE